MRLLAPFRAIVLVQLLFPLTLASAIPGRTSIDPHGTVTPFNETLPVATSLSERAWPDHRRTFYTVTTAVGLTFLVRFRVLELVSPADALAGVAANDLVFFYKAAFAVARVLWAQDEPRKVRRARINGILLMFWSETPIRWDFLQGFFEHIIDRTYGGLVGGFEVTCVAEVGNDIVHVSLTMPISDSIPEAARAARDIGPG